MPWKALIRTGSLVSDITCLPFADPRDLAGRWIMKMLRLFTTLACASLVFTPVYFINAEEAALVVAAHGDERQEWVHYGLWY
jgi:hypothetical protein